MIDGVYFYPGMFLPHWLSVWDRDTASAEKSSDYLEKIKIMITR